MTIPLPVDSWLAALVLLVLLLWTSCLVLALLSRILRTPDRDVSVAVRPFPWPRVEIEVTSTRLADQESPARNGAG